MGQAAKKIIGDSFTVDYFERNLIFTKKATLAVYKIPISQIMFKSQGYKQNVLKKLENLFWVYRGKGQLLLLARQESSDKYLEETKNLQYENRFPEAFEEWNDAQREQLDIQPPWTHDLYILLQLPKKRHLDSGFEVLTKDDFKAQAKKWYQIITDTGLQALGRRVDLELEQVKEAINLEKSLYSQLKGTCRMAKGTPRDTERLIKRNFLRAIGEPELHITDKSPVSLVEKRGTAYFRQKKAAMLKMFGDSYVKQNMQSLEVHHRDKGEGKVSYQTFLSLVDIPDDNPAIDSEWLYWLMINDFPVDVSVRFNILEPGDEKIRLRRKRKEYRGEAKSLVESGKEVPDSMIETDEAGRDLEYKLGKGSL